MVDGSAKSIVRLGPSPSTRKAGKRPAHEGHLQQRGAKQSALGRRGFPTVIRSVFRAHAAQHIDDEADHQNEAKASSADDGTAKVKTAAAEQEKQDKDEK